MRNVLLQNFPQNTSNNSHHAEWKICRVKRTKYQDAAPDTGKQFDIRRNCICRKAEQVGKNIYQNKIGKPSSGSVPDAT